MIPACVCVCAQVSPGLRTLLLFWFRSRRQSCCWLRTLHMWVKAVNLWGGGVILQASHGCPVNTYAAKVLFASNLSPSKDQKKIGSWCNINKCLCHTRWSCFWHHRLSDRKWQHSLLCFPNFEITDCFVFLNKLYHNHDMIKRLNNCCGSGFCCCFCLLLILLLRRGFPLNVDHVAHRFYVWCSALVVMSGFACDWQGRRAPVRRRTMPFVWCLRLVVMSVCDWQGWRASCPLFPCLVLETGCHICVWLTGKKGTSEKTGYDL